MSILTYFELYDGVYGSRDPRVSARTLRRFMADFEVIPVSRLVARRSARLRFTSRAAGRPVKHRTMDILIAATALTYSLQLVTSDTDFDDIPGLQLLDPRTLPYDALGSIPTVAGITTT